MPGTDKRRVHPIRKGMILCAGLGTRLQPITERYPKPLVPVLNLPNLLHNVALLSQAGINDIVINLFHLPDRIEEFLKEWDLGKTKISLSRENILLGTGGGVKKAQAFIGDEPFVLANCDFVSNISLAPLIARHFETEAWGTMALLDDPKRKKQYSPVGIDAEGRLCSLPKKQTRTPVKTGIFTGIHILSPEIFSYLEEKPSGINEVLYPSLMTQTPEKARGEFVKDAFWYDTGDVPALWSSSLYLLSQMASGKNSILESLERFGQTYREVKKGVWVAKGMELPSGMEVEPPVMIGSACILGSNVRLGPEVIVGSQALIGDGAQISKAIVLPNGIVEKGQIVKNEIVFEQVRLPAHPLP